MDILVGYVSADLTVKGSRFFAELLPCENQQEARDLLKSQKRKHRDATHVVHAFFTGTEREVSGMSDDGEPSGTAGRPVLDTLRGRELTNALLTVARWFGGTLLGTGGLVKAYGDAAKHAIAAADAAGIIIPLVEKRPFSFSCDYALYDKIKRMMSSYHLYDVTETFAASISVRGTIDTDEHDDFATRLRNMSGGKITI